MIYPVLFYVTVPVTGIFMRYCVDDGNSKEILYS